MRVSGARGYEAIAEYMDHHAPVRTRQDKATAGATRLLTITEPARIKTRAWQPARLSVLRCGPARSAAKVPPWTGKPSKGGGRMTSVR
ncbi:MAG TPA: hypothetical protein VHV82_13425 [Sporichthyaceae bacterium]|nr:hypothetical protein [Sporichthyaceae bacterium]